MLFWGLTRKQAAFLGKQRGEQDWFGRSWLCRRAVHLQHGSLSTWLHQKGMLGTTQCKQGVCRETEPDRKHLTVLDVDTSPFLWVNRRHGTPREYRLGLPGTRPALFCHPSRSFSRSQPFILLSSHLAAHIPLSSPVPGCSLLLLTHLADLSLWWAMLSPGVNSTAAPTKVIALGCVRL